ncbi:MAG: hypothetical protein COU32_01890 [Candidatus Magasanikbacteria bacterium CG10_big_fil_rev_8_21_14_0_10_42_10]|uniref:Uncharacterized protein n=2 Tax=Candidatus Magasanikiibacteriota TaxID=1752731 RepID=A0A2H0TWC1_9BACT|nr:MAG: hypothetical protein COU32_01890 [Candidatus Magasanikbacteria bacterium CG10_big_fil_rev_8_21_14_0_10_42_10]PIZ92763.1 MAG: hypothetical protein COX82_04135 [Candidatus Magasanikbacteria bacterium CG_4_10_14_0_2_um_filter_41_10]
MINKTKQELQARLKKIQDKLGTSKEIELKKLSEFGDEIFAAFERAMNTLDEKTNVLTELKKKKTKLKQWKISSLKSLFPINLRYLISMPFIYGMIIPGTFFHLCLEIYHRVAFRLYGIPLVKARDYFIFDRQRLPHLNWLEKINCGYCSYFNNLMRYATEISGRTERYWCPIKHAQRISKTHSQYNTFVDYLDAPNFRKKWEDLRNFSDIERQEQEEKRNKKHPS